MTHPPRPTDLLFGRPSKGAGISASPPEAALKAAAIQRRHPSCASHCCPIHGCKYQHVDCPVATSMIEPEYPANNGCEICEMEDAEAMLNQDLFDDIFDSEDELYDDASGGDEPFANPDPLKEWDDADIYEDLAESLGYE